MTSDNLLKPNQYIKANLDVDVAKHLIELHYGLKVKTIVELTGYDDRNYHVLCEDQLDNPHISLVAQDGYVFKIINSLDSQKTEFVDAQTQLLIFLKKKSINCPIPVKQKNGFYFSLERIGKNDKKHIIRLLVYYPGEILEKIRATADLLKRIGLFAARLDKELKEFSHPAYETQTSLWVLPAVPEIRKFLFALNDTNSKEMINNILSAFEQKVLTITDSLDKGIIHGDLNEFNIIVNSDRQDVEAIIDFGDSHKSCYIFELAICLCYMIIQTEKIDMAKYVISGYQIDRQLSQQEKEILKLCVCARLSQSLVLACYSFKKEPNNLYLMKSYEVKLSLLKKLWFMSDNEVMKIWGISD